MKTRTLRIFSGFLLGACNWAATFAATIPAAPPELPPTEMVARVIRAAPSVHAAASQIRAEEANRQRLEAGTHEWSIRLGRQQLKARSSDNSEQRYKEWNADIERPIRLPGKAAMDAELGAKGVAIAEIAHGDMLHETSRKLLKAWFVWLKENVSVEQWQAQMQLLEKQSGAVQRRQQLGDAARLETILVNAAKAQAEAQWIQSTVRLSSASEDLRRRFPELPLIKPLTISEPQPITGNAKDWIEAILEHSHELGIARGETQRAHMLAGRSEQDRLPDPTLGVHFASERGGEDRIFGAYIAIPLPGEGRRAQSNAHQALASVANNQEADVLQRITAEAAVLVQNAEAAFTIWQAGKQAASNLNQAAEMTARAYQLGEGSLSDLLQSRRQAHEAQLVARLLQLEALELRYRLMLDAHQLWDLD